MSIVPATDGNLRRACELLNAGQVVAMPTETVYGLAGDATDPRACARIFNVKNRPHFDPLIVHVADMAMLQTVVTDIGHLAESLMRAFWPGPLTLVLPRTQLVPDLVTANLPTVAVRMPAHPVALRLIRDFGKPLAAPSANPFGRLSPTTAQHVADQLGDRVPLILDGGPCAVGVESTIVDLTLSKPCILRHGRISADQLCQVVGPMEERIHSTSNPKAPGQLESHYAPRAPLRLIDQVDQIQPPPGSRAGLLSLGPCEVPGKMASVEVLSPSGDLIEAATHFFAALHRLDQANLDVIYALAMSREGVGLAMMDRLQRASSGSTGPQEA